MDLTIFGYIVRIDVGGGRVSETTVARNISINVYNQWGKKNNLKLVPSPSALINGHYRNEKGVCWLFYPFSLLN